MAIIDGIRAYYKLENQNDALGVNNLTNDGTVTFATAGKIGNAAGVFSTTKRLSIANAMGFTSTSTQTISFWINLTAMTAGYIFDNFTSSGANKRRFIYVSTDKLVLFLNTTDNVINTGTSSVTTATWYHIALTQNGSNYTLYLNGVYKGSGTETGAAGIVSNYFSIGNTADGVSPWGAPVNGIIDEFGIWDRVLSGSEITNLYNTGNGIAYPFLTAYTLSTTQSSFNVTGTNADLSRAILMNTSKPSTSIVNVIKP